MIAEAMRFFGAEVLYYSRTHKPEAEAKGIAYRPLADLLKEAEIVCTCLHAIITCWVSQNLS